SESVSAAAHRSGASLRIDGTSLDERGELLDTHVLRAHAAHNLEVLKLGYFIYCRVVARREIFYARLEPRGLSAQLRYSCVQVISPFRGQEACRIQQSYLSNTIP